MPIPEDIKATARTPGEVAAAAMLYGLSERLRKDREMIGKAIDTSDLPENTRKSLHILTDAATSMELPISHLNRWEADTVDHEFLSCRERTRQIAVIDNAPMGSYNQIEGSIYAVFKYSLNMATYHKPTLVQRIRRRLGI